jgi:glycosyltransferase involved in cell wall biosynthesis
MEENRLRDGDRFDVDGRRAPVVFSSAQEEGWPTPSVVRYRPQPSALNHQHICVVTETYTPEINGVALTLANLVRGLLARGHTVSIVHPRQRDRSSSSELRQAGHSEVILVRGLPLPGYGSLQFGVPAQRRLRRSWTRHRPAAVYVATEGPLGWSAVRMARKLGIPAVSGFHTNFHHYCKHYGVGWLQTLAFRYLRWFHNQTDCTLVANEALRSQLQRAGFNNVSILERGVDSQLFTPQRRCTELRREWGVADQNIVLVYVGRLAAEKNLGVAIEAYREMKTFSENIKFVLVGDGPQRRVLQTENPDLIFAGVQTGEQLAKYYASADVFLFPSETETFGNVTLEAMASGLAVIAYNYAGAKLHIVHGETGVLVPFGSAKDFVGSACSLIRDPRAIKRMRKQAREYATCLNWSRVVEEFETLLIRADKRKGTESHSKLTRGGLATQP